MLRGVPVLWHICIRPAECKPPSVAGNGENRRTHTHTHNSRAAEWRATRWVDEKSEGTRHTSSNSSACGSAPPRAQAAMAVAKVMVVGGMPAYRTGRQNRAEWVSMRMQQARWQQACRDVLDCPSQCGLLMEHV